MNVLNVEHISKLYGDRMIFDDVSFGIQEGDKIGIIGINGMGKSTLLKMIAGVEEPDQGQIVKQNGLRIAYLPQNPVFAPGATIASYIQEGELDDWKEQTGNHTDGNSCGAAVRRTEKEGGACQSAGRGVGCPSYGRAHQSSG